MDASDHKQVVAPTWGATAIQQPSVSESLVFFFISLNMAATKLNNLIDNDFSNQNRSKISLYLFVKWYDCIG